MDTKTEYELCNRYIMLAALGSYRIYHIITNRPNNASSSPSNHTTITITTITFQSYVCARHTTLQPELIALFAGYMMRKGSTGLSSMNEMNMNGMTID